MFLSESVLTPPHGLATISRLASQFQCKSNADLLKSVYNQAALSVKSQASLFQTTTKFKPAQHRDWLKSIAESVTDTIQFESSADRANFLAALPNELGKVQNYAVPDSVRQFIDTLESQSILWGLVANEGPLYPAVLKYVGVKPFCTVMARESVFKPLPITFQKAWQKVPRESRKNIWYVGSAEVPYDNVYVEGMRCVLLGSVSDGPAGLNRSHTRISALEELYPQLFQTAPDLSGYEEDYDDDGSVVLTSFKPKNELLPLGEKDQSLADLHKK